LKLKELGEGMYYSNPRIEIFELLKTTYPEINDTNLRILEIGCGAGVFRKHFNNVEYWGIEPNSDQAEKARKIGVNVIGGTFEEVSNIIPDNYFNIVVLNDVLEHMHDHDLFLRQIVHKGKKEFTIIGSVPNVRFITVLIKYVFLGDWAYKEMGVLDRTHLRFFTKKSLKATLIKSSYELIELKGINKIPFSIRKIRGSILRVIAILFGSDCKFMQFAFIVKYIGNR